MAGLNDGRAAALQNYGEAECIYFAEKLDGMVATDDAAAYDFAQRRLGLGRVVDSIPILRLSVANSYITPTDASAIAGA